MYPATESRARPLQLGRLAGMCIALAALGTIVISLGGSGPQSDASVGADAATGIGTWGVALAWLALAVVLAIAGGLAGASLVRNRLADTLREARMDRQALASLLDVWQWHTDAEHRLTRLVPPSGAPATAWSRNPGGQQPLWERFECDPASPSALREGVLAQTEISDLQVAQREAAGITRRWLLRGTPRFDAMGCFAGYVGTARPLETAFASPSVQSLLDALPGAVLVGTIDADGIWRVEQLNTAARELIGADGPPELGANALAPAGRGGDGSSRSDERGAPGRRTVHPGGRFRPATAQDRRPRQRAASALVGVDGQRGGRGCGCKHQRP